ncbi:MAG: NAD(P)H-dependent oxidoreductase, partial [Roseimicrobium sp.]
GSLATAYAQAAEAAGHSVRLFKLGDVAFDPILHQGYGGKQELEPGLKEIQDAIAWADHLVFVYPNWWGSMPALLKGFFDRVLSPGFAFKYRDHSPFWDRLLVGRSAHAFVTMDTPPWYYWLVYRMVGHRQLRSNILEFCGIKPVRTTSLGPVRHSSPAQREAWLQQVARYAKEA